MKLIFAMSPTILLVVYAQLITKWRIGVLSALSSDAPDKLSRLMIYLKDPLILSTYLAALGGSAAWIFVVERYDIAIAFPVYVGLTVLAMALCGTLLFGEHIGMVRAFGIVMIVAGVALVSRS
jgi:multidrug transporter EmrE-like cation transporter